MTNWFCSGSQPIDKAGIHVNATLSGSAIVAHWILESMAVIDAQTRRTWETSYSSLTDDIKNTLQDISSRMVALNCIAFDNTGYLSREADMLMNLHYDKIAEGLAFLKDFKSNSIQTP